MDINNVFLNMPSYDTLIETKIRAHRPKDLFDIAQLDKLRKENK